MGYGNNEKYVYLIDFGLSHKYRLPGGNVHIKYDDNVPFRGTHRYASINAHDKVEQTRRDDLESLAYVLIYFLKGGLPWQNLNVDKDRRRQVIGDMKKRVSITEITESLPDVFATYLTVVRKLQFAEKPNYTLLRELFKKCFNDMKFVPDGLYDWTQVPSRLSIPYSTTQTITNHKKKSQPASIEIIDEDNNKQVSSSRKKRKTMELQKTELTPQPKSARTSTTISLRPRKNRRSTTTMATMDYEASHEVIEISDDCS